MRYLWSVGLVVSLQGCLSGPGFLKQSSASLTDNGGAPIAASVLKDEDGVLTAAVSPTAGTTQTVTASDSSAIAGTQISFPPGAVALATDITIQEGASLVSEGIKSEIGMDSSISLTVASAAVVVQSSVAMDAAAPFTVSIPVAGASLALLESSDTNYAILYNVYVAAENGYVVGVIPKTELSYADGVVAFQTRHFGSYQLVISSDPIVEKQEVATTREIVTQKDADVAPMVVDTYQPYVASSGKTVTVRGKNFRNTMTIALGSTLVSDLKVVSDVSASFVMPTAVKFGFTDIEIAQEGVVEKGRMFALEQKTSYPLITMDESGVCSGVNYYDANGDKRIGTKDCGGTDSMKKSVYDVNGDGKVDQAATSDAAGSALSADFAVGAAGTTITAPVSGTLSLPGNGSFYTVSGTGSFNAISSAAVGARVTLRFSGSVQVVTSASLQLANHGGMIFKTGAVLELVSLGSGVWREIGRHMLKTYVSVDCGVCSQTIPNDSNGWAPTTPPVTVSLPVEVADYGNEFNTSTSTFVPAEGGLYRFSLVVSVTNSNYPSYCSGAKTAAAAIYVNGVAATPSIVNTTTCGSGVRNLSYSGQFGAPAGSNVTLGLYNFDSSGSNGAINATITGTTGMLVIEKID